MQRSLQRGPNCPEIMAVRPAACKELLRPNGNPTATEQKCRNAQTDSNDTKPSQRRSSSPSVAREPLFQWLGRCCSLNGVKGAHNNPRRPLTSLVVPLRRSDRGSGDKRSHKCGVTMRRGHRTRWKDLYIKNPRSVPFLLSKTESGALK